MDFTGIGDITNVFGCIAWVFTVLVWGVVEVTRRRNGNGKGQAKVEGTVEAAGQWQSKPGANGIVTEDQIRALEATWNGKLARHELYCANAKRALEAIEAVRADLKADNHAVRAELKAESHETREVVVRLENRLNNFMDRYGRQGPVARKE